ncbi:dimeric alpha-beta barrel containing protein [Rutstroemia sp. NJR-2017a BBW]|nr:dimeric alpha-beta barrel containing protein [Rutstroemia sp. NJR-2017a BBW]
MDDLHFQTLILSSFLSYNYLEQSNTNTNTNSPKTSQAASSSNQAESADMPVTERVIFPVKGGVDDWKEALKFMLQTLKTQDGYVRTRWGPHSEDQQKLELLIGWETISAQEKFQASPAYQEMQSHVKPVLTGPPSVYFIEFKPYAPKEVIDAHFVEMITVEQGSQSEDDLRAAVSKFKDVEGCTGVASGLSLQDVDGKGKLFVAAVGWDGLEESAKGNATTSITGTEIHHVNFRFPIKGFRGL